MTRPLPSPCPANAFGSIRVPSSGENRTATIQEADSEISTTMNIE